MNVGKIRQICGQKPLGLAWSSWPQVERHVYLGLFLLPFGRPRRFTSVSHFGGRPRRFPCPIVRRSRTAMASVICSRSFRRSTSILFMSIFQAYLENAWRVTHLLIELQFLSAAWSSTRLSTKVCMRVDKVSYYFPAYSTSRGAKQKSLPRSPCARVQGALSSYGLRPAPRYPVTNRPILALVNLGYSIFRL